MLSKNCIIKYYLDKYRTSTGQKRDEIILEILLLNSMKYCNRCLVKNQFLFYKQKHLYTHNRGNGVVDLEFVIRITMFVLILSC